MKRPLVAAWCVLTAGGCTSERVTAPSSVPCSAALATQVALALGDYMTIDPASDSGCVAFAANPSTTDSVEYLVEAQSAGGAPGDTTSWQLRSAGFTGSIAAARLAVSPLPRRGAIPGSFDRFLRQLGRARRAPRTAAPVQALSAARVVAAVAPPAVGSLRTFTVCATLDCGSFRPVTARVRALGAHVAIYVDTLAPANGLDSADVETLARVFDSHVYSVDTSAFAAVSDVDSNGVVLMLMTPVVNSMVTRAECESGGYIAGFFFPPDLDPGGAAQYNDGEIFYTIVADPNGALAAPTARAT